MSVDELRFIPMGWFWIDMFFWRRWDLGEETPNYSESEFRCRILRELTSLGCGGFREGIFWCS